MPAQLQRQAASPPLGTYSDAASAFRVSLNRLSLERHETTLPHARRAEAVVVAMDPFSITAGSAGLLLFCTKILTEGASFFQGVKGASAAVNQIVADLKAVKSILAQLKDAGEGSASFRDTLPRDTLNKLNGVMKTCKATFRRLEKFMHKYYNVGTSNWGRIKWDRVGEAAARKLGDDLAACKATLTLHLSFINM